MSDSIRPTVKRMAQKVFPFSLMILAGLVACGVLVPAFYPHGTGRATVLLVLWDWGIGFATVAIALLIILAVISSLVKVLSSAPVIIVTLFGAVFLLVGTQIVQLYVVNHLIHPEFRYTTPSWGLWLEFAPSLVGVFVASSWIRQDRSANSRLESQHR